MKITILGANGSVGSPTAFHIAAQKLADEIVMIGGKRQNVLLQHAMDISTAVSGLDVVVRAGTYEDMVGSSIVINAAGLHQDGSSGRLGMLHANIPFIEEVSLKIRQYCPDAAILTATNPVGPLNYCAFLAGKFDRRKLIGYTINDSYRFRELVAEAFGVKVSQVEATVIGEHGPSQVPLFSSIRIDGRPVVADEAAKQRIRARAPEIIKQYQSFKVDRTAGWTCAYGLAAFVRALVQDTGDMLPCSLVLDGEYGLKNLSMSVPAVIGKDGVRRILEWELAPDEQQGLEISVNKLKSEMRIVEEELRHTQLP